MQIVFIPQSMHIIRGGLGGGGGGGSAQATHKPRIGIVLDFFPSKQSGYTRL